MNAQYEKFRQECFEQITKQGLDLEFKRVSLDWLIRSLKYKYSYHFEFLGRPIIQYPQDMIAVQELIWQIRPDLIIETGIAHGGSIIQSAAMLALIDLCDAIEQGTCYDPRHSKRKVIGIDIEIRPHNRVAIESHPLFMLIEMIEGSSIDPKIVQQVHQLAKSYQRVMLLLDSLHTHKHVLAELEAYTPLVSSGSYCVVFDTIIEDLPAGLYPGRPWGQGNNPKTAVYEFLKSHPEFVIDKTIPDKLLITVSPDGYLKKVS